MNNCVSISPSMKTLDCAMVYSSKGYSVIPLIRGEKKPAIIGWNSVTLPQDDFPKYFDDPQKDHNIGIKTGKASGGLVDIDIDSIELIPLAPLFLPRTFMVSGRKTKPRSHWWYISDVDRKITFQDPDDGAMLVEIRSNGDQTAVPPSRHGGEITQWYGDLKPSEEDSETLKYHTSRMAACGIMLRRNRWSKGGRQDMAMIIAGTLALGGVSHENAERILKGICHGTRDEEIERRLEALDHTYQQLRNDLPVRGFTSLKEKIGEKAAQCFSRWAGCKRKEAPAEEYHRTDMGNAKRFLKYHGDNLKYCSTWKTWFLWNGKNWEKDQTESIAMLAKDTVMRMYEDAMTLKDDDPSKRVMITHATKTESRKSLDNMAAVAQSEPQVAIIPDALDTHKMALNCENGIVDLKNGTISGHQRELLISKVCNVEYRPEAQCPVWLTFLAKVTNYNQGLIDFLQRSVGYSLTGNVSEEVFWFLYGTGANGKSTFINTFMEILGDSYSSQVNNDFLMIQKFSDKSTERADLKGSRFVSTTETREGKLDETLIKTLTGGDKIKARYLYRDHFTFWGEFKIWMAGNQKPVIKGTDEAIWRRVLLVPFTVTIPPAERDKMLREKLRDEYPGILAWAIRGCLEWQKSGLKPPLEVSAAIQEYREDMDSWGRFFAENCVPDKRGKTHNKDLMERYRGWTDREGEPIISQKAIANRLKADGFANKKSGSTRVWWGFGLTSTDHDEPLPDNRDTRDTYDTSSQEFFTDSFAESPCSVDDTGDGYGTLDTSSRDFSLCSPYSKFLGAPVLSVLCVHPPYVPPLLCTFFLKESSTCKGTTNIYNILNINKRIYSSTPEEKKKEESVRTLAVDIETTGLNPVYEDIKLIGCYDDVGGGKVYDSPAELSELLADPGVTKVIHNASFDVHFLETKSYNVNNYRDTMLMSQVLDNNEGNHKLDGLAKKYLGIEMDKSLQGADNWKGFIFDIHRDYCKKDCEVTLSLYALQLAELSKRNLLKVYEREERALPAIIRMQRDGMPFDSKSWTADLEAYKTQMNDLGDDIEAELSHTVKLSSPSQLLKCLQSMGITLEDTGDEALAMVEDDFPVCAKIRKWRELNKLCTSYGKALIDAARKGRLYPSWRLLGSRTGRMSCKNPNIQQTPRVMRKYYKTSGDTSLVIVDYSQIELRIVAELANDRVMLDAFRNKEDLHTKTAQMILGKDAVTKEARQMAKACNFGLVYGMSPQGLKAYAKTGFGVSISEKEAVKFRSQFLQLYRGVAEWQRVQSQVDKIVTLGGRIWPDIPKPKDSRWRNRLNYPVQGTGAEGLKEALALLLDRFEDPWKLCAIIHDEIVLEVPDDQAERAKSVVEECMIEGMKKLLRLVPVEVDGKISKTWEK